MVAPHLFSGLACYRLSDPDAAVPELEKAISLNPSDAIAHTWLGYAYSAQLRYEPALKELGIAQELDPNNVDVEKLTRDVAATARNLGRFTP